MFKFSRLIIGLKKLAQNILAKISSFFHKPWAKPRGGDLMITSLCNFRCSHCNIWQEQKKPELTLAEWQKIIIDLRQWLGSHYPLSVGGGEPFLRPDILDILDFLVKHDFQVTIETNGSLIDEQLAKKLVALGISEIRISLYSFAPELHNKMRGIPEAHKKAMAALNFLADAKKATNSKLKICLGLLVNDENIGSDALALIEWANKKNFHILIQALDENFKNDYEQANWYEFNKLWPKKDEEIILFFAQVVALKKQGIKIDNTFKNLDAFKEYFLRPEESVGFACPIGYRTMNIDPQGQIFFCFKTGSLNKSLVENSAKKLWFSPELQAKRELIKNCQKVCRIRCYYQDNLIDKFLNFLK